MNQTQQTINATPSTINPSFHLTYTIKEIIDDFEASFYKVEVTTYNRCKLCNNTFLLFDEYNESQPCKCKPSWLAASEGFRFGVYPARLGPAATGSEELEAAILEKLVDIIGEFPDNTPIKEVKPALDTGNTMDFIMSHKLLYSLGQENRHRHNYNYWIATDKQQNLVYAACDHNLVSNKIDWYEMKVHEATEVLIRLKQSSTSK